MMACSVAKCDCLSGYGYPSSSLCIIDDVNCQNLRIDEKLMQAEGSQRRLDHYLTVLVARRIGSLV